MKTNFNFTTNLQSCNNDSNSPIVTTTPPRSPFASPASQSSHISTTTITTTLANTLCSTSIFLTSTNTTATGVQCFNASPQSIYMASIEGQQFLPKPYDPILVPMLPIGTPVPVPVPAAITAAQEIIAAQQLATLIGQCNSPFAFFSSKQLAPTSVPETINTSVTQKNFNLLTVRTSFSGDSAIDIESTPSILTSSTNSTPSPINKDSSTDSAETSSIEVNGCCINKNSASDTITTPTLHNNTSISFIAKPSPISTAQSFAASATGESSLMISPNMFQTSMTSAFSTPTTTSMEPPMSLGLKFQTPPIQFVNDPPPRRRRTRTNFSQEQVNYLRIQYRKCRSPTLELRQKISKDINISVKSIEIWFKNERARSRKNDSILRKEMKESEEKGKKNYYQSWNCEEKAESRAVNLIVGSKMGIERKARESSVDNKMESSTLSEMQSSPQCDRPHRATAKRHDFVMLDRRTLMNESEDEEEDNEKHQTSLIGSISQEEETIAEGNHFTKEQRDALLAPTAKRFDVCEAFKHLLLGVMPKQQKEGASQATTSNGVVNVSSEANNLSEIDLGLSKGDLRKLKVGMIRMCYATYPDERDFGLLVRDKMGVCSASDIIRMLSTDEIYETADNFEIIDVSHFCDFDEDDKDDEEENEMTEEEFCIIEE